ncbi:cbb3-type cytochrome oxidase assembly protein CcoS [Solimonas sp. SE-A11]|nr:cbb3-type cytochrome oxidase assembly protein CcoS [Solimonas sp. SE-A11]MDM4769121.1 cbb3-type cytochrome oxidase assembly protein CcoS [Solimonas sp. SE-A11]
MEALYLLIPMGLLVVLAAALIFAWTIGSGQYENLDEQAQTLPDDD